MRRSQEGFTAVELLVTLFVAVAFIATAFQLYSAVVSDSGEARFRAKASNIAYAELRRWTDESITSCSPVTNQAFTIESGHGLDNPVGTVTVECRTNGLMYVKTVVAYGPTTSRKDVQHAMFTAK